MSPENAQAAEPEPQGMSEISRLTGVFFEPSKAFADISERPRWFAPLLIIILATMGFYALVNTHVGWQGIVEQQFSSPNAQQRMERMSPEQRQQIMSIYEKGYPIAFTAGPILLTPIVFLVISAVLLGMVNGIMSAGVSFRQLFSITCYANLTIVVTHVLATVVMFVTPPDRFNVFNPLAFNPGAFMDPSSTSKFLYTLASRLDLIAIWALILAAIGIKAAAGKRISFGGALFSVMLPWAVMIFVGASLAGMFA